MRTQKHLIPLTHNSFASVSRWETQGYTCYFKAISLPSKVLKSRNTVSAQQINKRHKIRRPDSSKQKQMLILIDVKYNSHNDIV